VRIAKLLKVGITRRELSRSLQLLLAKENIRSAQEDEIPQGYQKLVEEYYKKLSNPNSKQ